MAKLIKVADLLSGNVERFLSPTQLQPDPALVAEGWERRFTADKPRATEAAELYAKLGYEVRLEVLAPEKFADDCEGCRSPLVLELRTVYTRRKRE